MAGSRKSGPKERGLPSLERVRAFIAENPGPLKKRDIARAFDIRGEDRIALKQMLRQLEEEGTLELRRGRRLAAPDSLPPVTVILIEGPDADGEQTARPTDWPEDKPRPRIFLGREAQGDPPEIGTRVLARLRRLEDGSYEAKIIKRLDARATRLVGIVRKGGVVESTDRRDDRSYRLGPDQVREVEPGDLIRGKVRGRDNEVLIEQVIGKITDPGAISLIAATSRGLPMSFSAAAEREAEAAKVPTLRGREDLRDVPLVTIDGADARDFDDAVWAEPDDDPANPGGWRCLVAIADVAHYVRPGSPLDRAAHERGNSTYFPDRVIPMLPEALSNGLCSLRPNEPRACMAFWLWLDAEGRLIRHRLVRGLMRSAARLTYTQVQDALDGRPDDTTSPLLENVLKPLLGAYGALEKARQKRGTLEIDLPERQIRLGEKGEVEAVTIRPRLTAHKLIEEMMIAANVAAAETLERLHQPALYRIHDNPDPQKLQGLEDTLRSLDLGSIRGRQIRPGQLTRVLQRASAMGSGPLVSELVLRCQAQARYQPENIGHFGLALQRYTHFTSPIRRYADLIVHRALIRALGLGGGGLSDDEMLRLESIGQHISSTERRSIDAERDAHDRFLAGYLSRQLGAEFEARVSGVTRFGLFVTFEETGAQGFVPIRTLPQDQYRHDPGRHALVGARHGRLYRLGLPVAVRLIEADPVQASTVCTLLGEPAEQEQGGRNQGGHDHGSRRRPPSRPGSRARRPGKGRK